MSRPVFPAILLITLTGSLITLLLHAQPTNNPQPPTTPTQTTSYPNRVNIDIRGLDSITKTRLLDRLGDRLIYAQRYPATIARASDAAFFIERYLLNQGFDDATVTGQPSADGQSLIILVNEGKQRTLGNVTFEGAENVNNETLRELLNDSMLQHERRILTRTTPYVADRVQSGIENINNYYKAAGYWQANAVLSDEITQENSVDLVIAIYEGPLHPLQSIEFEQAPQFLQTQLSEIREENIGKPATADRIDTIRSDIASTLRDLGYERHSLSMLQQLGESDFSLVVIIEPGEILEVGQFSVENLIRTRQHAVLSRFTPLQGKTYSPSLLNREVNSLLASGAFNSILIEDSINPNTNTIDFTIIADEVVQRKRLGFYGGFGSFEGAILGSTYEHLNIFGSLRQFNARLEYTGIGGLGEIRVIDQRFLGSQWEFSPRLYALRRSYDGYTVSRTGLSLDFDRSFGNHYSIDFQTGIEYASLSSIAINPDFIGPSDYTSTNLSLLQTLDHRDSKTLPRDGWITRLETSLVTDTTSNDFTFLRARIEGSYYQPLGQKTVLSLGARAGLIEPIQGNTIPIDKRFFIGGSTTVRGFPERQLGPKDDNNFPIGGEAYHIFNAELTRDIAGPFALATFVDTGNLFSSANEFDFGDLKTSAGLGLRINLPTGPIRADYGWNMDQQEGDPSGAFHFSIGVAF